MRRALFLGLVLGLAACAQTAPNPEQPSPVGVSTGGIEVTPLDAPTPAAATPESKSAAATPSAGADSAASTVATSKSGVATVAALDAGAVLVSQATATTPHPKPRPAGLGLTDAETGPVLEPKSQPQLLCEAAGGLWGQSGGAGGFLCQKRTKDSGKVCHKKGDCSGECLGPSQTCSPVAPLMGCNDVMDSQGRMVTLCIN